MSVSAQCAQLPTGAFTKPAQQVPGRLIPHAVVETAGAELRRQLASVQREIQARTGQRISIAAARTAGVAQTASRLPGAIGSTRDDGVCVVSPGAERAFLAPLLLQRLHGLPQTSLRLLQASGLVTIGELQRVPKAVLQAAFGPTEGLRLWRSARGMDPLPPVVQRGVRGWLASRAVASSRRLSACGAFSASAGQHRIRSLFAGIARRLAS